MRRMLLVLTGLGLALAVSAPAGVRAPSPTTPAAVGLDLLCRGLRRNSADDNEALERGILIYEALYAEISAGETW